MPGIAGVIATNGCNPAPDTLLLMVKAMLHEPFYVSGTYGNGMLDAHVGWVCHRGSFSDCMPAWNESQDVCLIFSGEHFADATETDRLKAGGHSPITENAGYLVHLYEDLGSRFFEHLNGAFSGLILDLRQKKIILFNDRYGLGRIYYHETKDAFYFSSEAKSLLRVLPELRQLDVGSLGEFFSCGCALQDRTLFSEIRLLPGGSVWSFQHEQPIKKERYFHPEIWEAQPTLAPDEFYRQFEATFARILPRYFQGGAQVALSLTGGLDSRMIAAWAPRPPYKLQCYTFGGMNRECVDVKIARRVARTCQQYHDVVSLNRRFFAEFPGLAKRSVFYTDGAMDVTGSVELYVNRLARDLAPVRLTGNYGDEVLRGNTPLKPRIIDESVFEQGFVSTLRQAADTLMAERHMPSRSFVISKQLPWHHYARFAIEQTQLSVRSPYIDNELVQLIFRAPPSILGSVDLALGVIADGHRALSRIPTDRGHVGRRRHATGRVRELWQATTARAEYAYDYGMPHWLARVDRSLAFLRLERWVLGRHKFYHFRTWYRRELANYVRDVLLDSRTLSRSYLAHRRVEDIVAAHLTGKENHTEIIHKLLTSEIVQRQLIEK